MKIQVIYGNIVNQFDVEAIVNSANANLRLGSGVAGAIHTAAGPELEAFCKPFAPIQLGQALITPGFNLPNAWVIHVRAAHFINDLEPEKYLQESFSSMMQVANETGIRSIAIPAIGIGVFKCPPILSASIMAKVLKQHAKEGTTLQLVRICVANHEIQKIYESAFYSEI